MKILLLSLFVLLSHAEAKQNYPWDAINPSNYYEDAWDSVGDNPFEPEPQIEEKYNDEYDLEGKSNEAPEQPLAERAMPEQQQEEKVLKKANTAQQNEKKTTLKPKVDKELPITTAPTTKDSSTQQTPPKIDERIEKTSNCKKGYTKYADGLCYKVFDTLSTVYEAAATCQRENGNLVAIPNHAVNEQIFEQSKNIKSALMLGIVCTENNPHTCSYINGERLSNASYLNFYRGHPDPNIGYCVQMNTWGASSEFWISVDCETARSGFACQQEIEAKSKEKRTKCEPAFREFEGSCYKQSASKLTARNAHLECRALCGKIVDVNSVEENSFLHAFALSSEKEEAYTRLGSKLSDYMSVSESRATFSKDYNNFGHIYQPIGECVMMALQDDVVHSGKWINNDCEEKMYSVCERSMDKPCITIDTDAEHEKNKEEKCDGTFFTDQAVSLLAPNQTSATLPCTYLFYAPKNHLVQIDISALYIHANASLELYDHVDDIIPSQSLVAEDAMPRTYYTGTNVMKMRFVDSDESREKAYWRMDVSSALPKKRYPMEQKTEIHDSGCNQGLLMAPGVITSPLFPRKYMNDYSCSYRLGAPIGKRIRLTVTYMKTYDEDKLTVKDGADSSAPLLFWHSENTGDLTRNITITSTSNRMYVHFSPEGNFANKGFVASFEEV